MARPWYVIEGPGDGRAGPRHCFTVVNAPPRLLAGLARPHLATHRIVAVRRRRLAGRFSEVRLTLVPRSAGGRPLSLAALLVGGV